MFPRLLSGFANDNDSVWAEGELQKYDVVRSAATGGPLAIFWSDDYSCDCEERGAVDRDEDTVPACGDQATRT